MPETRTRICRTGTRRPRHAVLACTLVVAGLAGGAGSAFSQAAPDQLLFGPKQYVRTTGAPNQFTETITVPTSVGAPFLLHIVNGQSNGQNRISSAWIEVNNVQVAGPADFGQHVAIIDQTITLNPGTNHQDPSRSHRYAGGSSILEGRLAGIDGAARHKVLAVAIHHNVRAIR